MADDEGNEVSYCCPELRDHDAQTCDTHASPWACSDFVVVRRRDGTYGLPVRDGDESSAASSITIRYCPWCGSPLPGHETRPPTAADRAAGMRAGAVGERPIVRAAEVGDLAQVRALLSAGVPAQDTDPDGWTALHAATVRGHREVVQLLLESGADVDALDDGFTPLLNAAREGDRATVSLLIEAGADITFSHDGRTPLSMAADYGNVEVLALLLDAGADPNAGAPLVYAAEAGYLDCVELLVAAGANLGVQVDRQTAAQLARHQGHEDVARLLERLGTPHDHR